MKYFHDFSTTDIPSKDHLTCETNMWRNIFYIDTFYPLQERVNNSKQFYYLTKNFNSFFYSVWYGLGIFHLKYNSS